MSLIVKSVQSNLPVEETGEILGNFASNLFDRVQDLYGVSLFLGAIVNSVKYLEQPPQIAKNIHVRRFVAINHYFMTYIDGLLLFLDLKNLVLPDSKGRWFWQRHWQKMLEQLGWAATHSFDFVDFLHYLEAIPLNKTSAGAVSLGSALFKVVACTFEIWENIRSISNQRKKALKAFTHRKEWLNRSKAWPNKNEECIAKIAHFNGITPKSKRLRSKWEKIQNCEDPERIKKFCEKAAARDLTKFEKCKNKQIRSAIAIIFCASLIALVALGLTVHFAGLERSYPAMIGMVALPVAFTTADLAMLIMYKLYTVPKVRKLKLSL